MNTRSRYFFFFGLVVLGLLIACDGGGGGNNATGSSGVVQIVGTSYHAGEGTVVNILVERRGGADGYASVNFATSDVTATGGSDYVRASGTLTWPAGTSGNTTVSIPITDDSTAEPLESFSLTLSGVSGAALGGNSSATISILDNDAAQVAAFGAITALNSMTVNGIRYDTSAAAVYVDGAPATVSDLAPGHTVSLNGTANFSEARGTADEIRYSSTIIGPVESVSSTFGRLIVLGQTVLTDEDTVLESSIADATLAGITLGSTLRVSGHFNANGDVVATRIEPDDSSAGVRLVGTVAGSDLTNMLFNVNRLTVDYSNAALIDLPEGMPTDGLLVTISGTLVEGVLVVDEISSAADLAAAAGQRVHLGGMINRFDSVSAFDLNGIQVTTEAGTLFNNGTAGDLQPDAEITIDGLIGPEGNVVVASQITFGEPIFDRSTAVYEFTDFTNVSVLGISRVTVTQGAEYFVEVSASSDALSDIQVGQDGDTVSLGGGDGQLLNAYVTMPRLDRLDVGSDSIARVTVRDFDQPQMIVNVDGVSSVHGDGLVIGSLVASVTGVSLLDFGGIRPIGSADIDISGVSQATLNMDIGSSLTGSVRTGQGTGESTLFYYGTNASVNVTIDSQSRMIRLGDTRS